MHRIRVAFWTKPNEVVSPIDAASLVAGLKHGDERATRAFIDHYYEPILGYLFRMLQQRQCAEDVCQETFVRAIQRIDQVSEPQALKAWLYRIATNMAHDYLRQRPREASLNNIAAGWPTATAHDPPLGERLYAADLLTQLGEEHRTVVILRFYEDLSLDSISHVLGIPLGTVKSRLHYALRRLREYVQAEEVVKNKWRPDLPNHEQQNKRETARADKV